MATTIEPTILTENAALEPLPVKPDGILYRRLYS